MRLLDQILRRFGLVRIRSYGLELTRDGRLRSQHAIVLADGWGGPIVGWTADDAAPQLLEPWKPAPALPAAPATDDEDWDAKLAAIRTAPIKSDPPADEDENEAWVDDPATILDPPRQPAAVTASVVTCPPVAPRPRLPPPLPTPRLPAVTAPPSPPRRMPKGTRTRAAVADPWKHEPTSPTKLSPVQIAALESEALANGR